MSEDLKQKYKEKKGLIEKRLQDFRDVYSFSDEDIFAELCFCLLTPQTKAKSAGRVIEKLKETGLLYTGDAAEIKKWMASIRFNESKSKYIIEARRLFSDNDGGIKLKEKLI